MYRRTLCLTAILLVAITAHALAATLEVPQDGGDASGIGYFSGWKCPPNDNITIVVDGGAPIPVPSGVRRNDTASACGNDGRNGYLSQINFNLLGTGSHTAVVRQNGVPFAQSTFRVQTLGTPFLAGASGTYELPNFPQPGQITTVEWSQGGQNFVITGTRGGPTPTPTPSSPALVRYRSALTCFILTFTSTLEANGYSWVSTNGSFSAYQPVTRTTLGPFTESNESPCGNHFFSGTFSLTPGHRYALIQTLNSGEAVVLQLADEGLAPQAADAESGTLAVEALVSDPAPIEELQASPVNESVDEEQ